MVTQSLEDLLTLFNIGKKRDVEAHCRKLIIRSEDFSNVILTAGVAGLGPYAYVCHFTELAPESLQPSAEELTALGKHGVGEISGKALKAVRKLDQIFKDRRLVSVHLFHSSSHKYWHMFYFDQRDYQAANNHWNQGPHLHYSQNSFTRESLSDVWSKVCQSKPEFPKSIHVRYDYHHNRLHSRSD